MISTKHIAAVAIALLGSASTMMAQQEEADTLCAVHKASLDLLQKQGATTSALLQFEQSYFPENPAAMYYFMPYTLSDFRITGSWNHQQQAVNTQEGNGHLIGNVDAHSYMRLNPSTVVWGTARFTTGQIRGIEWSNGTDIPLVSPYILGDSVGGNLSTRQYSFSGGYAGQSRGWSWGAEASYIANISYRNRDPRDKIVVSDLNIKLGGSKRLGSFIVGLGASLRVYNQECDLEFFNPNNDTRTYLLTGLGNYYSRFSGISDQSTAYKGLGYSGTLQLLPVSGRGFSFSATAGNLRLNQVLREFNNLDLTRTDSYTLKLRTSYTLRAGGVTTGVLLSADLLRRPGYENIFGTSVGSNYEKIGSRRNYLHDRVSADIAVPVEFQPGSGTTLRLLPGVRGYYSREDYRNPNRALETHNFAPHLTAALQWRSSERLQWEVKLTGERRFAHADRCKLPGLNTTTSSLGRMIVHDFEMLTANATHGEGSLGALWQLDGNMALKISGAFAVTGYHRHGAERGAIASVAMVF